MQSYTEQINRFVVDLGNISLYNLYLYTSTMAAETAFVYHLAHKSLIFFWEKKSECILTEMCILFKNKKV